MDSPLQGILESLASLVQIGQTGKALDSTAASLIRLYGCEPAFLGYKPPGFGGPEGYPATLCVSINGEVIHGIPDDRKFQDGDVVSLDLGLRKLNHPKFPPSTAFPTEGGGELEFWEYDDGATTVIVGHGSAVARRLVTATKAALEAGVAAAVVGNTTHDIGRAIAGVAHHFGFGIIEGYGGHGIGSELHLSPHIPNEPLGDPVKLEAGHRYAIEPMFSSKRGATRVGPDGWVVKLVGGGVAAHFERVVSL